MMYLLNSDTGDRQQLRYIMVHPWDLTTGWSVKLAGSSGGDMTDDTTAPAGHSPGGRHFFQQEV